MATPSPTPLRDWRRRPDSLGHIHERRSNAHSRATTVPAADTPNGGGSSDVTLGYFNTDAIASITQDGTTTSHTLDAAGRRSVSTSVTGSTTNQTVTRHYTDASDNPGWATDVIGSTSTTTRYAESIGGDLAATITDNGTTTTVSLPVVDPHGDVVSSIDMPSAGDPTGITAWIDTDEYGNPLSTALGRHPRPGPGSATDGSAANNAPPPTPASSSWEPASTTPSPTNSPDWTRSSAATQPAMSVFDVTGNWHGPHTYESDSH